MAGLHHSQGVVHRKGCEGDFVHQYVQGCPGPNDRSGVANWWAALLFARVFGSDMGDFDCFPTDCWTSYSHPHFHPIPISISLPSPTSHSVTFPFPLPSHSHSHPHSHPFPPGTCGAEPCKHHMDVHSVRLFGTCVTAYLFGVRAAQRRRRMSLLFGVSGLRLGCLGGRVRAVVVWAPGVRVVSSLSGLFSVLEV